MFLARYRGYCWECKSDINVGDVISSANGKVRHDKCESRALFEENTIVKLPRNRTVKDRCDRCFIIHPEHQEDCE